MTSESQPVPVLTAATMPSGRDDECQRLFQAYQRSKQSGGLFNSGNSNNIIENIGTSAPAAIQSQELVLIQGRSGTGKTTLAQSIAEQVIEKDNGFFLSGKFELLNEVRTPYEVFSTALAEFLDELQHPSCDHNNNGPVYMERNERIRQAIHDAVGIEGHLLSDILPVLADLMPKGVLPKQQEQPQPQGSDEPHLIEGMETVQRFQFLFSKFVRAIAYIAPLVFFFDDLQWSDPASLSLLQAILESQQSEPHQPTSLLVICAFRDHEDVSELHPESPTHFTDFVKYATRSKSINVEHIALKNLDEAATRRLVAAYLNVPLEVSKTLGAAVFVQCEGNPFHAVQLLRPLMRKRLLLDKSQMQRLPSFDVDDIFEVAEATQTVDEYLRRRFAMLPQVPQQLLQVAACMGDCVDHPALCTVVTGNETNVEESLDTAVTEGFLLFDPKHGQYRFAHDRVRQAVLSTIQDVNTKSFEVGYQLWTKCSPLFLSTKMFVVVNLLNHGTKLLTDGAERYKAAAINLEAGTKAASLAAFPEAARYFRFGIEFLDGGGDYWNEEYDLTLSLFNAAADAEFCNQNFERSSYLVDEVFRSGRSLKDKLRAYVIQINSFGQRGNLEAAIQVGVDAMKQLGEPLPSQVTSTAIFVEIMKARLALRGRSNDDLITLPRMQNENKIACLYVFTNLIPYAFQAASNYVPVIGARLVRLCLKHGMHRWCASGFATFGLVICTFDKKEGYRLGKLALNLVDRYGGKELLPHVHVSYYCFIHHWMHPLEECLKPFENICKVGLEVGDVECAMLGLCSHAVYSLLQGKPLAEMDYKFKETIRLLALKREDGLVAIAGVNYQYVRFLTGQVPLSQLDDQESNADSNVDSLLIPYSYYMLRAELAYLFGNLRLALIMLEKGRSMGFVPSASYNYAKACFIEALICAYLVRNGFPQKRKHLRIANANLKKLTAWARNCPQNYLHKQRLVEAELMSLRLIGDCSARRKDRIQTSYDEAIDGATREGFLHESALANELAGDFMNRQRDSGLARRYWDEACAGYHQWGASEKAKHTAARISQV